jgi:hypothetical protein
MISAPSWNESFGSRSRSAALVRSEGALTRSWPGRDWANRGWRCLVGGVVLSGVAMRRHKRLHAVSFGIQYASTHQLIVVTFDLRHTRCNYRVQASLKLGRLLSGHPGKTFDWDGSRHTIHAPVVQFRFLVCTSELWSLQRGRAFARNSRYIIADTQDSHA